MNCCYDLPGMDAPYLESFEQLDSFFTDFFHKIKFHKFRNVSKCLIHRLRLFKSNNTCELCDTIQDKDNGGKIMVKKCSVLKEEVIDVFHLKFYIPKIENVISYCSC